MLGGLGTHLMQLLVPDRNFLRNEVAFFINTCNTIHYITPPPHSIVAVIQHCFSYAIFSISVHLIEFEVELKSNASRHFFSCCQTPFASLACIDALT